LYALCHTQQSVVNITQNYKQIYSNHKQVNKRTTQETDFNRKWHLNVTRIRITGNPKGHFMTPHSNAGFNSKGSEDIASDITKVKCKYKTNAK